MKKLTGEQSAELLFNWLQTKHPQFGNNDLRDIDNLPEWLPIASDLASHLADNPSSDISAWPWQAKAICLTQIAQWMQIAMSPQCAAVSLPIDKHLLGNQDDMLRWILRSQIVPMSVFEIPGN